MRKVSIAIGILLLIGVGVYTYQQWQKPVSEVNDSAYGDQPEQTFNKAKYSTSEPASLWVIVNKEHPLPTDYEPEDLVIPDIPLQLGAGSPVMQVKADMVADLEDMVNASKQQGLKLMLASAYRDSAYQAELFENYAKVHGEEQASRFSAKPGQSEHQTGLAVDFMTTTDKCTLEICFATTPEGKWLAANAYKYGFVLHYAKGKEKVTGYQYEPWHFRYVGPELAAEMKRQKILTLEEFFEF